MLVSDNSSLEEAYSSQGNQARRKFCSQARNSLRNTSCIMEVEIMEDVLKAVAKGLFVQQSVNVGSKLINNKRVTKNDEQGFWLSLLLFGLVNLPAPQPVPNTLARRY